MPADATTEQSTTEKTYTQKDLDIERAHAQKFQTDLADTSKTVAALTAELNALKDKQATTSGDPKIIEARIAEKEKEIETRFSGKLTETEQRAVNAEKELKQIRVVSAGWTDALKVGFLPGAEELVKVVIEQHCDFVDGKRVVKGPDGKPMYSKTNPRELMQPEEFLRAYGADKPFLMKATTEGGADKGEVTGGSKRPVDLSSLRGLSPEAIQKHFENNPEASKAFAENGFKL